MHTHLRMYRMNMSFLYNISICTLHSGRVTGKVISVHLFYFHIMFPKQNSQRSKIHRPASEFSNSFSILGLPWIPKMIFLFHQDFKINRQAWGNQKLSLFWNLFYIFFLDKNKLISIDLNIMYTKVYKVNYLRPMTSGFWGHPNSWNDCNFLVFEDFHRIPKTTINCIFILSSRYCLLKYEFKYSTSIFSKTSISILFFVF
jgi:hypothetical protein